MNSLLLLCALVGASPTPATCAPADYDKAPYTESYNRSLKTGRPLLCLKGAHWCTACPRAHAFVSLFHRLGEYCYVDNDHDQEIFNQLGGGPIPQLVIYRKTVRGWTREAIVDADHIKAFADTEEEKLKNPPKEAKDGDKDTTGHVQGK